MYILKEYRNFKTFSKKKNAIALESYYYYILKNVGNGIEYDIDSACGLFIHFHREF